MDRVASAVRAVEDLESGRLASNDAGAAIDALGRLPPLPTWLFALAAAAGSVALSVIFGVEHVGGIILIFLSGGAGAILRRNLARCGNLFLQPFCAALLAGLVGGLAVRFHMSSSLRLVAVCPCMVLVPGPHFLNGVIDLVRGRLPLGAARLLYALLVVAAISLGLLLGLACLGVSLPTDPPGRIASLWLDLPAAGVAVAAYCIFFSAPLRMLPWPVCVGMFAHALRWVAITQFGVGVAGGALVASFAAGLMLAPVSRAANLPFAAIGFASVVSLIPGLYLFRMASGLVDIVSGTGATLEPISATIANGEIAAVVILAISLGLIVPKMMTDYFNG